MYRSIWRETMLRASILEQTAVFAGNVLLFAGPAHVGKLSLAWAVAAQHNCHTLAKGRDSTLNAYACGECASCMAIQVGTHPDVLLVQPKTVTKDGKMSRDRLIPVGAIHESRDKDKEYDTHVYEFLESRPKYKRRVIIIQGAEYLRTEAANSLLKLLEEPPHRALFIILAEDIQAVLPTIVSRSTYLSVPPITDEQIIELATDENTEELTPELLEFMAGRVGMLKSLDEVKQALNDAHHLYQVLQQNLLDTLEYISELEKKWQPAYHPEALHFAWRQANYTQRAQADKALMELQDHLEKYANVSLSFQVFAFELRRIFSF